MFRFEKKQKIINAGGIKLGGQPGELPTALTASIFYIGHKIVEDKKKGTFDKARAEALINRMDELSDMTTNPFILDVVGASVPAFQNYITFISKVTQAPIQIDAISPRLRMETIKWHTKLDYQPDSSTTPLLVFLAKHRVCLGWCRLWGCHTR
ncbi:hypothetical protein GH146_01290 [archaeon]|nr:hypothetical protein [archaeon]